VRALAFLFVAACGGASGQAPSSDTPPFVVVEPQDARLAMAAQDLKGRIGHEVAVDVDASLLKEHASHLSIILADALETIARGIERARADRPAVVLRACSSIATLKVELDDRIREPTAYVDAENGVLLLRVPSGVTYFATDESVATAFVNAE
jgi:uncharacterized phage protein gp47/JayE